MYTEPMNFGLKMDKNLEKEDSGPFMHTYSMGKTRLMLAILCRIASHLVDPVEVVPFAFHSLTTVDNCCDQQLTSTVVGSEMAIK